MTGLGLALDALASYRLTRLVTADALTEQARMEVVTYAYAAAHREVPAAGWPGATAAEVVGADEDPPKLAYLVTCPWCSGFYVAAAVTALRIFLPRAWSHMARALALSAAAGLLSTLEDR